MVFARANNQIGESLFQLLVVVVVVAVVVVEEVVVVGGGVVLPETTTTTTTTTDGRHYIHLFVFTGITESPTFL